MSRRKLKAPRKRKERDRESVVHDRRAQQLDANAAVRTVTVDDPYEYGAKISVIASLRDDPLGRLHVRDQIDHAQYAAGRHWQRIWGDSEVGGIKAMDTTKEPVDGGKFSETFTDRHRGAILELKTIAHILGTEGYGLLRDVLGNRMFVEQVAAARGVGSQRGIDYLARRLRECLETLAKHLGYA